MRITWGAMILALAVAGYTSQTTTAQGNVTPEQLEGHMKTIASTQTALRGKMKENQMGEAAKDAQVLVTTFGEVEKFFAQRSKADGVKFAQIGKTGATAVAAALTAGDAEKANAELKTMGSSCGQCHAAYREGTPGNYTIKAGSI